MSKNEFLCELEARLSGLPREDIAERLSFYSEMIDDRIEEGLSEEEAVSSIDSIDEIVSRIVSEIPFTKIVREKVRPKRSLKALEIALLILGFPLWGSVLLALFVLILAVCLVVFVLIACLWVVEASSVIASFSSVLAVFAFSTGGIIPKIAMFGIALAFAGLSILLFFGCERATRRILDIAKSAVFAVKSLFIGREELK